MTRPRRVYRLDITYPDEPALTTWPVERLFLSRSGARSRASKLRGWGCTVTIHPSDLITWPNQKEPMP